MRGTIVFITGTDTGVGKTELSLLLIRHLRSQGLRVAGLKPFCSGERSDAERLRREAGADLPLEVVNPFYFKQPVSPSAALRGKRVRINAGGLAAKIADVARGFDLTVVEGAGGVMVPIQGKLLLLHLIERLQCNVVLVGRNSLGTLNHSLLSFSVLKSSGRAPKVIVLMENSRVDASSSKNPTILSELVAPVPVVRFPWLRKRGGILVGDQGLESFLKKSVAKISALGIVCPRRTQRQQTKVAEENVRQALRAES